MKKETIEKLFTRYIGIYDNILFEQTGEHITEDDKNTIQQKVDSVFKEYEYMSELAQFTDFSKKIVSIIEDVMKRADTRQKELFHASQLVSYDTLYTANALKHFDEECKKIVDFANETGYLPYRAFNSYLEPLAKRYNMRIFMKNLEALEKVKDDALYEILVTYVDKKIIDYPIQFTKETLHKYIKLDDNLYNTFCTLKNSDKNKIINEAIFLYSQYNERNYVGHIQNYIYLNFIKNNQKYELILNDSVLLEKCKSAFSKQLVSKNNIINYYEHVYNQLMSFLTDKKLLKSDIKNIKKLYKQSYKVLNDLNDVQIIRCNNLFIQLFLLTHIIEENSDSEQKLKLLLDILLFTPLNENETVIFNDDNSILGANENNAINRYFNDFNLINLSNNIVKYKNEYLNKQRISYRLKENAHNVLMNIKTWFNNHVQIIKEKIKNKKQ